MTKKPTHKPTASTRTKSPKCQTVTKAIKKKTSTATSLTNRPKAKRRRPPRRVTQEQIQMTFAAAKAKDIIHEYFVDFMEEPNSPDHRKGLQFLAKYFRPRGVRVSREGHVTFPTGACTGVDLERLIEKSYLMVEDFLEAMAKEADVDLLEGFIDELVAVGWRQGFIYSRDSNHHDQWLVPLVVGLNVSTGNLLFDNRGDRAHLENSFLSPAQLAFASQLPELWMRWQAEKVRRSLMHVPGNVAP